jgi:hypothetical protein
VHAVVLFGVCTREIGGGGSVCASWSGVYTEGRG